MKKTLNSTQIDRYNSLQANKDKDEEELAMCIQDLDNETKRKILSEKESKKRSLKKTQSSSGSNGTQKNNVKYIF